MNGMLEKKSRGLFTAWQMRSFQLDGATAELSSKNPKKASSTVKKQNEIQRLFFNGSFCSPKPKS